MNSHDCPPGSRTRALRLSRYCGFVLLAVSSGHCPAGTAAISISGVVKARSGAVLDGVPVSARADGSNITTSVYTDARGSYAFPELVVGHYRVWAQAIGYARSDQQI